MQARKRAYMNILHQLGKKKQAKMLAFFVPGKADPGHITAKKSGKLEKNER